MGRLAVVGGVFLALFIIGYYGGFLRDNCRDDVACFNARAQECKPTDVAQVSDNNVYTYSVRGSLGVCRIHVILERAEAGAPAEFRTLEGQKMVCKIPHSELEGFSLDTFDRYMSYCHGLLKEGLYELILRRVYSNLVGQMGSILSQVDS